MGPFIAAVFTLIYMVLQLLFVVIIAQVIASWLIAFNVINTRNRFVAILVEALDRLTEPLLRPIRSFLPNLGGIDISPVILILLIYFLQMLIQGYGLTMA